MKLTATFLASILLSVFAIADDHTRDVQAALKTQGFYFGEVDGTEGPEMSAAVRRFQIRNGLQVTGKLNAETLAGLGMEAPKVAAAPSVKPAARPPAAARPAAPDAQYNPPPSGNQGPSQGNVPPAPSARSQRDLLRPEGSEAPPYPSARGSYPDDSASVAPPTPIPNAVGDQEYDTFFHGTPYSSAPLEVQFDTVRKAQTLLARAGYFKGAINGLPATLTSDALFLYQQQRRLTRTGRLDLQTLADLNLLPNRRTSTPSSRPFSDPSRRRDPSVDYRGIIR